MAKRPAGVPVTVSDIAAAQAIPQRFLELILIELRQAGLVKSYRGPQGGHVLNRPAARITVAEIIRLADGPTNLVKCVSGGENCPFVGACPFREMWDQAAEALDQVFERTTIQDLIDKQAASAADVTAFQPTI